MTTRPTSGVLFPRKDGNLWYVGSEAYSASLRNRHLMHFDSPGALPTTDDTPEGVTVVPSGTSTSFVSTTQPKWGGASLDLTTPRSYAVDIGATGEYWSFDCWVYVAGTHSSNYGRIFSTSNFELGINNGNKSIWFDTYTATAGFDAEIWSGNNAYVLNQWYHIALQRTGNRFRMWLDGVHVGTIVTSNFPTSDTHNITWGIGASLSSGQYTNYFYGYFDEVLVTHDNRWPDTSANITVPTGPYSLSSGATDPNFNDVSLLLHMDGANGSTTFTDSSSNSFIQSAVTNSASLSTSNIKFGTASGDFTTDGATVKFTNDPAFRFGTQDFTIEGWFKPDVSGAERFWCGLGVNATDGFLLAVSSSQVRFRANGSNDLTASTTISTTAFTHVAFVRSGTTRSIYVNGTLVASDTLSFNVTNSSNPLVIGSIDTISSATFRYSGYIDEFRITNGVARYTANFTPPIAAFPNS